uniref:THAP-type domain-containing protein n=1 Tax=Anopheles atroparvus TaxID=41427 RepID=A0AAG5DBI3_ANOAO
MPPSYCSVKGCSNSRSPTCSLYCFPKDVAICKKWVDFCSRPELYKKYDENGPEYLYKSSRICSDHFQPTDFNNPNLFSQGLKKGSIPTVNPATNETKANNGTGAVGGGGSGSSNGAGSPIDDKLLSAVAMSPNLSLIMAAAVAAAQQNHQQQQQQLLQANSALTATYLKRTVAAMSGSGNTSTPNSATTTTTTTSTPGSGGSSSAKRSRAVPPLATPTGALANLIQRQQQIKEQQRKAAALAASGLGNGQVSISAVSGSRTSAANASRAGPISLVTSKKAAAASINNNNNNVSNHNHNHSGGGGTGKQNHESNHHDHNEYGVNDVDMTGGETSEGDSSYQNSADEDYAYHQKQKVAKVEAVIPPSLKSQLTVTPATINNNTIIHSSSSTNGAGAGSSPTNGGTINYKEQYEQTLKELFACRKIVKNQNKAIKQLQGEIDFLNQLLKEK